VIVGKVFYHKDIRKLGSGNAGSTNTFRTFAPVAGMSVLLVDVLKGTLATLLPLIFHLGPHPLGIIFGRLAILGHTFS
ncbi:glycerol-3-phosphate acyltransferase, partial [Lactobacillus jensenii]|uniref:glycerol-3-phosphate acyltransferase n=1 Tax=Lactobacillus jensenii TaxID=109790 RepID=UPI00286FC842